MFGFDVYQKMVIKYFWNARAELVGLKKVLESPPAFGTPILIFKKNDSVFILKALVKI